MKKLILFTLLSVLSFVGFSQSFGRLKVHSGLYDNYVINGPDTFMFGWRTDRFQLKYNTNKRFIDFIKSDSTVKIYNKLILESPNDTMLSVRGILNANTDAYIYNIRIGRGFGGYSKNTVLGYYALGISNTGDENTAIGYFSLVSNKTGNQNTAFGSEALRYNTTGSGNTALGRAALNRNDNGTQNTAVGVNSLNTNINGSYNTAIGTLSLWKVNGSANVGIGMGAIQNMTSGDYNIGIGQYTGYGFTNGSYNVLIGTEAGRSLTTSPSHNIFIGHNSGYNAGQKNDVKNSMAIGVNSYTDKDNQYVYGSVDISEHNFRSGKVIMTYAADTNLSVRGTSRFNAGIFPQENITLLNTTNTSQYGVIYKGAYRFLHDFNYGDNGVVTTDGYNTFVGIVSGNLTMGATATNVRESSYNSGFGFATLTNNTTGKENTAIGSYSLGNNSTGYACTGVGVWSLYQNTTGNNNTALGVGAGLFNETGSNNLFLGYYAGYWGSEWNNKGFIDVIDRGDSASQLTSSPIIIDFNVDSSLQNVTFNADIYINDTAFMEHLEVVDSISFTDLILDQYGLAPDADSVLVADDGVINLRAGAYGELKVLVFNAGIYAERAEVIISSDGSVYLVDNSVNVTSVGGTDNNLNIYDGGTYAIIENKLGGSRTIKYWFTH